MCDLCKGEIKRGYGPHTGTPDPVVVQLIRDLIAKNGFPAVTFGPCGCDEIGVYRYPPMVRGEPLTDLCGYGAGFSGRSLTSSLGGAAFEVVPCLDTIEYQHTGLFYRGDSLRVILRGERPDGAAINYSGRDGWEGTEDSQGGAMTIWTYLALCGDEACQALYARSMEFAAKNLAGIPPAQGRDLEAFQLAAKFYEISGVRLAAETGISLGDPIDPRHGPWWSGISRRKSAA